MTKFKKKDYIYKAFKEVKNQMSWQESADYLEITYKSDRGHFKVLFYNLVCVFPITDYKKVISLLIQDNDGFSKSNDLHQLFTQMSVLLNEWKTKEQQADEKAEIQDAINTLVKKNDVLVDSFGVESIDGEKTIKLKTEKCYKLIWCNNQKALTIDYKAKSFVKSGYKFYVSADEKIKGLKHIIIGTHGLSCCDYHGSYKQAIETVNDEFITKVLKALQKVDNSEFLKLLNDHSIEKIPEFKINNTSIDVVNTIAEKENATIEEFSKQFGFDYDLIYDAEIYNDDFTISKEVKIFDSCIDALKPIITAFNQYRQDFISSDRECAAFIMALNFFIKTNKKTIAGIEIPAIA